MGSFDNIFQELEQTVEQEMTVSYWDNSDQNEIIQHYFADSFAMDSITTSPLPCDYDIANELIFLTNNPYDIEMDSYAEINGYTNNFDLNFVPHEQKKNQILDSLQIKLMALNDFDNCNNIDIVSFKNDQKTNIENLILTTEHNIEISCPIIMPASSMSTQTNLQTQTTITNEEIKLKRRREHNRIASRKCREKKLERIEFLESREQNLTNEIRSLEADVEKLLARKTQLRVALINYFGAVFDGNKPDPQSLLMLFDQARFKQLSNMH